MKPKETMRSIENTLRARQFLDGKASKETIEWAQQPESKRIIETQRLLRLLEKEKKVDRK